MKRRKQSGGRRGRRNRSYHVREERHDVAHQRIVEETKRRRQAALDRILPRLRRFCPLSEIGIVAPRDGEGGDRRVFYKIEGMVVGDLYREGFFISFTNDWGSIETNELERLAKIKRWDPVIPKNAMEILAEAYAGLHKEL